MSNEIVPYGDIMPSSVKEKMQLATEFARSGMLPNGIRSAAQVMVILQMAHELRIPPAIGLWNIAVINGRPALGADLMIGLIKSQPDYRGITETAVKGESCTVTLKRQIGDIVEEHTGTFTMEDARRAGLAEKGPWKQYPDTMLYHRACGIVGRKAYPDRLAGIYMTEEAEAIKPRDVTPKKAEGLAEQPTVTTVEDVDDEATESPKPKNGTTKKPKRPPEQQQIIDEIARVIAGKAEEDYIKRVRESIVQANTVAALRDILEDVKRRVAAEDEAVDGYDSAGAEAAFDGEDQADPEPDGTTEQAATQEELDVF